VAEKKLKWFSVLLMYPDYIADDWPFETFYAWVRAENSLDAVTRAQRQAVRHNSQVDVGNETDFHPLLVIEGRRRGQPTGAE